jgi:hypothetical protein
MKNYTEVENNIAASDVVFGIFQDGDKLVERFLIKGRSAMEKCVESGKSFQATVCHVQCDCIEEAIAMRQVYGDGDPL